MINIRQHQPGVSVITTMELAGTRFEIELLPQTDKETIDVFKPFRKTRNIYNPVTKNMDRQTYLDDTDPAFANIADDRLDTIVRNFWGIGVDGKELDGTKRENKILLGSVLVEDIEDIEIVNPDTEEKVIIRQPRKRPFRMLIFEKVAELGKATAEAEIKNSESSQLPIAEAGS